MADKGNFREAFILVSSFYKSHDIMAEKALWNDSGLRCKAARAASHPHKLEAGKAGQRQQAEPREVHPLFLASAIEAAHPKAPNITRAED